MNTIKGKFLKTLGWTSVGLGIYLLGLSTRYNDTVDVKPKRDDGILDAEFKVVED